VFTVDESWLFDGEDHKKMWAAFWNDVEEIERPRHFQDKTIFITFVTGTKDYTSVILLEGQRINGTFFIECVLRPQRNSPIKKKETL
jgi:hypothetical protein